MSAVAPETLRPPPDWPRTEAAILDEVLSESLAVELWLCVRRVRLWLETEAAARSRLFRRNLGEEGRQRRRAAFIEAPELYEAFQVFRILAAQPGKVDATALCRACMQVADWASEHSHDSVALHYATAATAVLPDSPEAANLAGLMYRRVGDWQRAELFYPRAIALSRRQRNATEYVCGHIGFAALLYSRGIQMEKAVRHLKTAARVAAKNGSFWLAGHALHDAMLLLVARNDYGGAEAEARRAADLYPLHDRRFPYFVADFAFVQLEQHRFVEALPMLELCLSVIQQPAVRALINAMLARSHAGTGQTGEFKRFRREAVQNTTTSYPEHAAVVHYHIISLRVRGHVARGSRLNVMPASRGKSRFSAATVRWCDSRRERCI